MDLLLKKLLQNLGIQSAVGWQIGLQRGKFGVYEIIEVHERILDVAGDVLLGSVMMVEDGKRLTSADQSQPPNQNAVTLQLHKIVMDPLWNGDHLPEINILISQVLLISNS